MADSSQTEWYKELADGSRWYPGREGQDVSYRVVAASLSKICRFTGHCRRFYSVAEHSVKLSYYIASQGAPELAYETLMHDGHESLSNDMATPDKLYMRHITSSRDGLSDYDVLEEEAEKTIRKSFGLEGSLDPLIKHYDSRMAVIEARYLLPSGGRDWRYYDAFREDALQDAIDWPYLQPSCWTPERAEDEFIRRFEELSRARARH